MIPLAKPLLGEEEKRAVLEVIESGQLAQGEKVAAFEREFAKYVGVEHAIATSNGTTALQTALLAHNIGKRDEVITSPFSFVATANAITLVGATPVFVDIDENTFNINSTLIEKAITPKTKAIMPVHLFGLSAEMEAITKIAKKHNLTIIEDSCQAHGAEVQGKKVGSFGTGCFSFYPTKNITTGEGGMITTNDLSIAVKTRKLINHGSEKKYHHDFVGYNYRMTDIAAALGLEQLKKLSFFNQQRKKNAAYLTEHLQKIPGLKCPECSEGHVFHQYTLRITKEFPFNRDKVRELLKNRGIDSAIFYPLPIHKQKAYHSYAQQLFPITEQCAKEVLSIPVHPAVTEEELHTIVEAFNKFAKSFEEIHQ